MGLLLPSDTTGLPAAVADALEERDAAIQGWASKEIGALGKWIDVPYSQSLYRAEASGGVWTVEQRDHRVFQYTVLQDLMILEVTVIESTTNASTGAVLQVRLPDGYQAVNNYFVGCCYYSTTTLFGTGVVYGGTASSTPGYNYLRVLRDILPTSTAFPNVTDELNIGFVAKVRVTKREF